MPVDLGLPTRTTFSPIFSAPPVLCVEAYSSGENISKHRTIKLVCFILDDLNTSTSKGI